MAECAQCGQTIARESQKTTVKCWIPSCGNSVTVHQGCAAAKAIACPVHKDVKKPKTRSRNKKKDAPAEATPVIAEVPSAPVKVDAPSKPLVAETPPEPKPVTKPPEPKKSEALALPTASKTATVTEPSKEVCAKPKLPPLVVYHATATPFDKIDLSYGRTALDFNPKNKKCFYAGGSLEDAQAWAKLQAKTKGGKPIIYKYEIDREELAKLQGYKYYYNQTTGKFIKSQPIPPKSGEPTLNGVDAYRDWQNTVKKGRANTLELPGYDYVEGPMLLNPTPVKRGAPAKAGKHQIALSSQKAVDIFNNSPRTKLDVI